MSKEKKLYSVYEKITEINDFGDNNVKEIFLGMDHAKSPEEAISKVKYYNHIKKENYLEKHEFYAKEEPFDYK